MPFGKVLSGADGSGGVGGGVVGGRGTGGGVAKNVMSELRVSSVVVLDS